MSKMINKEYDVSVIGGGYSGLVLAILCARAGLLVCIIEKSDSLGKKILATGNGRCNFTNSNMDSGKFYSSYKNFDINIDYKDSIAFLNSLGVIEKDINGYFYPITNQAKTVLDALLYEIKRLNIDCFVNTQAKKIERNDNSYLIQTADHSQIKTRSVAIATGGLASPKLGSNGDGLYIAKTLGFNIVECVPGLVGLKTSTKDIEKIAGVRAICSISYQDKSFEGEIQFNKDGISGYPVMCLSREISYNLKNNSQNVIIDFVPFLSNVELRTYLEDRIKSGGKLTVYSLFNGLCNEKISCLFEEIFTQNDIDISFSNIDSIIGILRNYPLEIIDTKGFDYSQVTAGGIDLNEIDLDTMMVKNSKFENLYFVGEILDVDGICGGYNLEWARYSASIAAKNIIKNKM